MPPLSRATRALAATLAGAAALVAAMAPTAMADPTWIAPTTFSADWTGTGPWNYTIQRMLTSAASADGRTITNVWLQNNSGGKLDVYASRSTDGGATWGTPQMISSPRTQADDHVAHGDTPVVASSADGSRVIAVWVGLTSSTSPSFYEVRAAVFSAGQWAPDTVLTTTPSDTNQYEGTGIRLATSADASKAIVMFGLVAGSTNTQDYAQLMAARYSATANPRWSAPELVSQASGNGVRPTATNLKVSMSGDGGTVIAVYGQMLVSGNSHSALISRRSTAPGTWTADVNLSPTPSSTNSANGTVALAADPAADRALVTWTDSQSGGVAGIRANRLAMQNANWTGLDGTGTLISEAPVYAFNDTRRSSTEPELTATADVGTAIASWAYQRGNNGPWALMARTFTWQGGWGSSIMVSSDPLVTPAYAVAPYGTDRDMVMSDDGTSALTVWRSLTGTGNNPPTEIYGSRWTSTGGWAPAPTQPISDALAAGRKPGAPALSVRPGGGTGVVSWMELSGTYGNYISQAMAATWGGSSWSAPARVSAAGSSTYSPSYGSYYDNAPSTTPRAVAVEGGGAVVSWLNSDPTASTFQGLAARVAPTEPEPDPEPSPAPTPDSSGASGSTPAPAAPTAGEPDRGPAPVMRRLSLRGTPAPQQASGGEPPTALRTTVMAPGPGRVTQGGFTGSAPTARAATAPRARVCGSTTRVRAAGPVTATCTLAPWARRALTHRRLVVRVVTTFTGDDGVRAGTVSRVVIPRATAAGGIAVTG